MDFRRTREIFLKIWKDPVWSKVISAGILFLTGIIAAKATNYSWDDIFTFIINRLSYKIPIYLILSVIGLYFIIVFSVKAIRKRKDPFWDEQMGNYVFKDLYNILLIDKWPVRTQGMRMWGQNPPDGTLMDLFFLYYPYLTKGIDFYDNIDDGHYLYGSLAPVFVGFGLVEAFDKPDENLPGKTNIAYKISAMGQRFHAKLNKIGLKEKIKEELAKKKKYNKMSSFL